MSLMSRPFTPEHMNRKLASVLALAIPMALMSPSMSNAQSNCGFQSTDTPAVGPTVTVCANGRQYVVPSVNVDGKFGILPNTTVQLGGGASFSVGATFNSDPFANFTFGSIIPAGFGVVSFDAFFSTPVIGGPYNNAHSYFTSSITLTNPVGASAASGTISAGTSSSYVSGFTNFGFLPVDVGSGACTVNVVSTVICPPGDKSSGIAPISPNLLTARLSYSHGTTGPTGASSAVSWQGGVELNNVTTVTPEPSTVALMTMGLIVVGAVTRRKRCHS